MKLRRLFSYRNWPNQLILSNLSVGDLLKVISNFQYYPLTGIANKNNLWHSESI